MRRELKSIKKKKKEIGKINYYEVVPYLNIERETKLY